MNLHIHLKSTTRPPASLCIQIALFFLLTAIAKAQLPASNSASSPGGCPSKPPPLAVNQHGSKPHQLLDSNDTIIWSSDAPGQAGSNNGTYIAIFNVSEVAQTLHFSWQQLALPTGTHALHDLWADRTTSSTGLSVNLPKHGSTLVRVDAH